MLASVMRNTLKVLLVEDDPEDFILTKKSLDHSKVAISLDHVDNGNRAMDYLFKRGQYQEVRTPDLVLLDLNLPGKDGRAILQEIKREAELKSIPVVILTTSEADEDILRTYKLGANCYVTKPIDLHEFSKVVKTIEDFWFTVVKLPPK